MNARPATTRMSPYSLKEIHVSGVFACMTQLRRRSSLLRSRRNCRTMPAVDLYIVAAGLGCRMRMLLPKALVSLNDDQPCLTTTLQRIGHKFRRVFVVTNIVAADEWRLYFDSLEATEPELAEQVVNLRIHSGLGDGHAVLQAMETAERITG